MKSMALSDTAEYWNDIRNSSNRYHPTHASVNTCHLQGGTISNVPDQIDCYYCKKLMTAESLETMAKLETNHLRNRETAARQKRSKIKKKWLNKYPHNQVCVCGFPMLERTNTKDGSNFLGCCQYPKCKHTQNK